MANLQLSNKGIRKAVSHDCIAGSILPLKGDVFFLSHPPTSYEFQLIAVSGLFFSEEFILLFA